MIAISLAGYLRLLEQRPELRARALRSARGGTLGLHEQRLESLWLRQASSRDERAERMADRHRRVTSQRLDVHDLTSRQTALAERMLGITTGDTHHG